MSGQKHTPKPWKAAFEEDGIWVTGPDQNANVICDIVGRIANGKQHTEEDEANALLIAAAPELLAACEIAAAALGTYPDRRSQVLAAIAKAKGEQP